MFSYGMLAMIVMAMFTGAALYINLAEQPARLSLDDRNLLAEWKPSYKRGFAMQATLAMLGALLGFAACFQDFRPLFLTGALLALANWPYTLRVIMPVNRILLDTPLQAADATTRGLIREWNRLHAGRTILGFLSVGCHYLALSQ